MVHGRLEAGEENSGKLVTLVRTRAKEIARDRDLSLVMIDGAPGIGCPVIASITGSDLALVVTEPTLSGMHDMRRVLELAGRLRVQRAVCVNKWDLNLDMTHEIEEWCNRENIDVVGLVPYDGAVTEAQIQARSVIEHSDGAAAKAIAGVWGRVAGMLGL